MIDKECIEEKFSYLHQLVQHMKIKEKTKKK